MNTPLVNLTVENGVALIAISRPEALNALNQQVFTELEACLDQVKIMFPTKVRGVIITGLGEKAFVAGADLKEIHQLQVNSAKTFATRGQAVFRKIEHLPVPVLAAVNGYAFGGGLELALSCDFIYASVKAKVGLPEVLLGLIPGFGGTVRLSRVVGINYAREMILTGEPIAAEEGLAIGLFNKVLPPEDLLPQARKTMEAMKDRGPLAVAAAKRILLEVFDQALDQGLQTEAVQFSQLFSKPEPTEGAKAFLEKRKPVF